MRQAGASAHQITSAKEVLMANADASALREAVGIFDSALALQEAIDELLSSGFDRAELSLLASDAAVKSKLGHTYRKVSELEDDPSVPRSAYVSTESIGDAQGGLVGGLLYVGAVAAAGAVVVSGGTLALAISAAVAAGGLGTLIGTVLAEWMGARHAQYLEEQIQHGGLLLWVRTWNEDDEARAVEILTRHTGRDVHVHTLPMIGTTQGPDYTTEASGSTPDRVAKQSAGRDHDQEMLDEALDETFPASDPVAMLQPTTNSEEDSSSGESDIHVKKD